MKTILGILGGFLVALILFFAIGNAMAGNNFPGNCKEREKKVVHIITGKCNCLPEQAIANPWKLWDGEVCKIPEKNPTKISPTSTEKFVPTKTQEFFPTATEKVVEKEKENKNNQVVTATVIFIQQGETCPADCTCQLISPLQTIAAAQATQAAAVSP